MNLILKRDPVWLSSLPCPSTSPTLLLLGGDGQQVAVPAPLLLAVSPLVRSILKDIPPPAFSPCFISFPDVTEEVLHAMWDILTTGTTGGVNKGKMEDVRKLFEIIGVEVSLVSCQENIQVSQAMDRSIKEENSSEGTDEKNIKMEVIVNSEEENSGDVEVEAEKSRSLGTNLCSKTVTHIESIQKEVKFPCNLCPQKFTQKQILVKHVKAVHDLIKIPCNLCPLMFTQKENLVRHIRAVHDLIKIPCNLCPLKFTQKENLVRHIRAVHVEIKIPCNLCPKKFTQKQNLVRHIRTVHDQVKVPCNLCSQKFTLKQDLMIHIRTVHDKVKIPCSFCPKKFTQKQNIETHIRAVHKEFVM